MTTALTDTTADVVTPAADAVVADPAAIVAEPALGADGTPPAADTPPPAATDYEFAMPEGFDATQLKLDDIKAFAKDLGLDPVADKDRAQKILDRVIAQRTEFDANMAQTRADVIAGWADQAKADKEIGGDKFEATLLSARSLIENTNFVTPEFKAFLDETGLGNHPEMIRWAARLAPHFAGDTPVIGNGGSPKGDPLSGMYDNPTSRHS